LFWLIEDHESDTVVIEDTFQKVKSETGESVLVSDEESVDGPRLGKSEKFCKSPSSHIESRTDIREDQRTRLESSPAHLCKSFELSVKVAIILLTMT